MAFGFLSMLLLATIAPEFARNRPYRNRKVACTCCFKQSPILELAKVPTMAEAGVPGYEAATWYALLAPAGVRNDVATRLNTEIGRILADPATQPESGNEWPLP